MQNGFWQRGKSAFLGYFWPRPPEDEYFEGSRKQLLCGFSALITIFAATHFLYLVLMHPKPGAAFALSAGISAMLCLFIPALCRVGLKPRWAAVLMSLLLLFYANVIVIHEADNNWRQEVFLLGPPMVAALLTGLRIAWLVTALVVINLILLALSLPSINMSAAFVLSATVLAVMSGLTMFKLELERKEKRLIDLRDNAQRADQEKSEFLAKMSHEIRTPLNGLSGVLQLLDETDLTPDQKELVATGRESGRGLMRLINGVLDYSKIAAHGVTVEILPVATASILESALHSQRPAAQAKDVDLITHIDPTLPLWLRADPVRLNQIITNFLSNAIKFSRNTPVQCRMELSGAFVKVSVSDRGIGLTEEAQTRIFKKFEQASSSTSRHYGGTGLGLAISKELAELMGGEIGVDSRPLAGSTFWFTFPLEACAASECRPAPPTETPAVQNKFPGKKVLVVEDNRTNQMIVRRFLESMEVRVDLVEDGRPALQRCTTHQYDLILMDIHLPDLDGVRATEMLRQSPGRNQNTPIVALSANILPQQTQSYLEAGMNACLGKPFRKDELAKVVASLIGERGSHGL
ncbi:ATP-binding protein [Shimia marina]|nr:ATP-binding protein [Shimia marina]